MFVIPMAGESRRFSNAGYAAPKFRLALHGDTVFAHAVGSFARYFATEPFLFAFRAGSDTEAFVRAECDKLKIARAHFIALERPTSGQAETVVLALDAAAASNDESVTIFNIDTFRPDYCHPQFGVTNGRVDGFLEVFAGTGANWSFVREEEGAPGVVAETAEKHAISNLCCTGLYHFGRVGDFRWAFANPPPAKSDAERRETYVAPLYNALIAGGRNIRDVVIPRSSVVFCGTPEEYEEAAASPDVAAQLALRRQHQSVHA